MKLFYSLRFRFIVLFTLFIIILCAVMSVSAITDSMHTAMKIIALEGSAIVEKAANVMDGDAFENLVKTMDSEDPFYEEARLKLLYIKEGTNSRFLFTMTALSRNGLPIYY